MIDIATLHLKCDELVLAVKVLMQARRQFTESNDLIGQAKALLKFGVLKCVKRESRKTCTCTFN